MKRIAIVVALACFAQWARAAEPVRLFVDATEAPRRMIHARLVIPVSPGALTLAYPKWIPGDHAPTNHVSSLVGLKIRSKNGDMEWHRDPVSLDLIHCEIPSGVDSIEVHLDTIGTGEWGFNGTAQLMNFNWSSALLYPYGAKSDDILFAASLKTPKGWKYATALETVQESPEATEFKTVSLTTLVDSPVIAGAHFRSFPLNDKVQLDVVAESEAALDPGALLDHYKKLVVEMDALFQMHHFRHYHFLLSLSDHGISNGQEHHESSDNRLPENAFTDNNLKLRWGQLLPHEFFHSWNGKYRRPAGLATKDYQDPMQTELLWVYEGLTSYYGYVLAARSGAWTDEQFRETFAWLAGVMDQRSGRSWRSLQDDTISVPSLDEAPATWTDYRRGLDYYREMPLIWLETDFQIRKITGGKKSLDDFCRKFFGGAADMAPSVVPYTFEDLVAAMNETAPYDWKTFFQQRVNSIALRAPFQGIESSGWRVQYNSKPNTVVEAREQTLKVIDLMYSIGLVLKDDGSVDDIKEDGFAAKAGIAPEMKLVAVNGRRWTADLLRAAIQTGNPELLFENRDFFTTYRIDYKDGLKYPHLVRTASTEDVLSKITSP